MSRVDRRLLSMQNTMARPDAFSYSAITSAAFLELPITW
jgi:hypothetical protein